MEQDVVKLLEEAGNSSSVGPVPLAAIERGASRRVRRYVGTSIVATALATTVVVLGVQVGLKPDGKSSRQPATPSTTSTTATPTPDYNSVAFPAPASVRLLVGESAPLRLFMHCGLQYAWIDSSVWETEPQSFNGGPPQGLSDLLVGDALRTAQDSVVFTRPDLDLTIQFRPTPPGREPDQHCL